MVRHKYLQNVTTLTLESDKCVGCGICETVCPHGVFKMVESKIQFANKDFCIECGACALNCPTKALAVNPGVGCAAAFIIGWLTGSKPTCGCVTDDVSKTITSKCC
jgi:NAD-dependent dihydropyrimidine dehydrogenase PreA subunit